VAVSMCFQHGVPLKVLSSKFSHTRFEPSGFTKNKQIPMAKSILDYLFRWLDLSFPGGRYIGYSAEHATATAIENGNSAGTASESMIASYDPAQPGADNTAVMEVDGDTSHTVAFQNQEDAPLCPTCGSITVRNGSCYRCHNCGESLGCS